MDTDVLQSGLRAIGGSGRQNLYAGDAAWREWFEICSVKGCGEENATALRAQIERGMYAQLARFGFTRADVGGEDPVSRFDTYFMLTGSREKGKPLKSYFRHRMREEERPLDEFVCGTLFGSGSGRIHDIVRDWIVSAKGWKPRSVRGEDGRRRIEWERADAGDDVRENAGHAVWRPGAQLDHAILWALLHELILDVSLELGLEKRAVALLCYVAAHDISMTTPIVLKELGVAKSRAYTLKEACMKKIYEQLAVRQIGLGETLLPGVLLAVCESLIDPAVLKKVEGGVA